MSDEPFSEFEAWMAGAMTSGVVEPTAFVLATSTVAGRPSARAILMKGFSRQGLVFYTGLDSRKSRELEENPWAAATFVWTPLHRQVRFEGAVSQVDAATADAYFATRPRGAQVAAHASAQSSVVGSRAELDNRFTQLDAGFGAGPIPRPDRWGGWQLSPDSVEFWQGRPNRFHDRILYRRSEEGWVKERLAP